VLPGAAGCGRVRADDVGVEQDHRGDQRWAISAGPSMPGHQPSTAGNRRRDAPRTGIGIDIGRTPHASSLSSNCLIDGSADCCNQRHSCIGNSAAI